jgi:hypothetical protein
MSELSCPVFLYQQFYELFLVVSAVFISENIFEGIVLNKTSGMVIWVSNVCWKYNLVVTF